MPQVKFEAWINENDQNDPGHMTMLDLQTGHHIEFTMGGTPNGFSVTVTNVLTDEPYTANSRNLVLSQKNVAQNWDSQVSKQRGGMMRFTGACSYVVDITDAEYGYLRGQAAIRFAVGEYNFLREAQVARPLASRCLTLLEELAKRRGQRLVAGKAIEVLRDFERLNVVTGKQMIDWS
ncbi:hypothetical protein [Jeongeupia chitinilytica]|uniref:Uncharacterized protein n=1 Tax=Jeongeupia chitinilytica TaxID=1041641 RepID=A0ABQ3GZF9_9NEIS|nr:hypothetical protein [Jeongeupia chitinilytica]GHD59903.1 hypothetical protein GCM10007350_11940 [Jeongeupia chitinilytica]